MSIKRKPSKLERKLILTPLKYFLTKKMNVVIERNDTLHLKPPYIILSNHTNNWDPLLINCFVEEPICFVAAEPLFHHPLLKRVLDYAGAIPKTKSRTDTSTIRNMVLAKKHNRAIGIFPEGNRCWDGQTEEIVYSTAKLVKMLNIPVIIGTIKGGYLTHPRWADSDRKGKISVSLELKWNSDELKERSIDDIHQKLTEAITFDELAWQREQSIPYNGERLANYLERVLYVCPACHQVATMYSKLDTYQCQACGYGVIYNKYGYFEPYEQPIKFTYIHEWNTWQKQFTAEQITKQDKMTEWEQVLSADVKYYTADPSEPFLYVEQGTIAWKNDTITFTTSTDADPIVFNLDLIQDVNIHMNNKFDFHYEEKPSRFEFVNPRCSLIMWQHIFKLRTMK